MTEILQVKMGNIDINSIDKYNTLKNSLAQWKKRLQCVQGEEFNCKYFQIGDYGASRCFENKHYLALYVSSMDIKFKQEIIDFLTSRIIDNINDIVRQINELIKE
jgi:hypothetical protein